MTKLGAIYTTAILCAVQVQAQNAGPLTSTPSVYGTTRYGGAYGYGVVYRVDQTGHETVLYSFTGGADGRYPFGSLVADSAGSLYGTTIGGGKNTNGTVFKIDPAGNETVIHNFGGSGGISPTSGVIRDSGGNLYGTAWLGGPYKNGVVFKINAIGNGIVLHTFTGGADGARPSSGVIRDSDGNLYGAAGLGGLYGFGVIYKVDPSGNQTVLYTFSGGADGGNPASGLTRDAAGNLYGTTDERNGSVFRLDPSGNLTVLYTFTGGADGGGPTYAGVVRDSAGNLYGTTTSGGANGIGVVFKIDPTGTETVLHNFTWGADGRNPLSGVVLDSAGNLYGTASGGGVNKNGTVYKIGIGGQGTVLYSFSGPDGSDPEAGVLLR